LLTVSVYGAINENSGQEWDHQSSNSGLRTDVFSMMDFGKSASGLFSVSGRICEMDQIPVYGTGKIVLLLKGWLKDYSSDSLTLMGIT